MNFAFFLLYCVNCWGCVMFVAGTNGGKQYLVKYKNLAHVHNRWVLEAEIAIEAPEVLLKFNGRIHRDKRVFH